MSETSELPYKVVPLADREGNLIKPKRRFLGWLPWNRQKLAPIGENHQLNRELFTVIKPDGTSEPASRELSSDTFKEKSGPNGVA